MACSDRCVVNDGQIRTSPSFAKRKRRNKRCVAPVGRQEALKVKIRGIGACMNPYGVVSEICTVVNVLHRCFLIGN